MQPDERAAGQKERLLQALLAGQTPDQAAEAAGVSPATAWRWRQCEKFQQRLARARDEVLRAGVHRLAAGVAEAADTLRRNLTCGVPAAENAAAAKLLDAALRYQDSLDLAARVAALEERAAAQEDEPWASTRD